MQDAPHLLIWDALTMVYRVCGVQLLSKLELFSLQKLKEK